MSRIVVVGSANVDLTTFTDQIPRPGETIFGRDFHLGFGGKGANQAVAAARCGAEVAMIGRVGDDLFGHATVENFRNAGVLASHVLVTHGVSSGVAPIFVDSNGQNRIIVVKAANDRLTPKDVDAAAGAIWDADFVIVQLEIPLETVYHTLRVAHGFGVKTILNPAPACPLDFDQLGNVDYIIPNETEAEVLTGIADPREAARFLLDQGLRRVIVTLGSQGALLASGSEFSTVPAFGVKAVDTSGAGDAFIGSLACFLAEGVSEAEAILQANLYAALSTTAVGTQSSFVSRERFESERTSREQAQPSRP